MIVNTHAVVLTRQDWGEADRLVTLYTEDYGKLRARCVGVNKPGRKMKALCEPFVWAEFRLHLSHRSDLAKVIGGQILSSFPGARQDYERILTAQCFCEMLNQVTPEHTPTPSKYELIVSALKSLETKAGPWLLPAYGLKLLELTGQGTALKAGQEMDESFKTALCEVDFDRLGHLDFPIDWAQRLESGVAERMEDYAGRRLRCPEALREWRLEAANPVTPAQAGVQPTRPRLTDCRGDDLVLGATDEPFGAAAC